MAVDFADPFLVERRRELDARLSGFEPAGPEDAPRWDPSWWAVVADWLCEREPAVGEWMAQLSVGQVPSFAELLQRMDAWPEAQTLRVEGTVLGRRAWALWKGPVLLRLIILERPQRAPSRAELRAALGPTACLLSDLRLSSGVGWLPQFFTLCERPIPETALVWGPPAMAEQLYALLRETHPVGPSSVRIGASESIADGFEQTIDLFAPQFVFVHGHGVEAHAEINRCQSDRAHALPALLYLGEHGVFGRRERDLAYIASRGQVPTQLAWTPIETPN